MPVHLRPEEMAALPQPVIETDDEEEDGDNGFDAAIGIAARSCLIWLILAGGLLFPSLTAMKKALLAANYILTTGPGEHWQEMFMPAVLLGFFGAVFGVVVAWRIASHASMGDLQICLASALAGILLAAIGCFEAKVIFAGAIPQMAWLALGVMTLGTIAGAFGFNRYTG